MQIRLKKVGAADVARPASQIVQLYPGFLSADQVRKSFGSLLTCIAGTAQTNLRVFVRLNYGMALDNLRLAAVTCTCKHSLFRPTFTELPLYNFFYCLFQI
jgi:hypothetical protein